MYKVIVAGTRTFNDYSRLKREIDDFLKETYVFGAPITIVSGGARGADKLGERYAKENDYLVEVHPADWDRHGKRAGYIRNKEMAEVANALIAFWDGKSRGTRMMIELARSHGLDVRVVNVA
ncbi:DUF2493 domain-containing protein [Brevibacillus borstelensis]|uniref:DUF2493 domain-containing protein n=1 Tax=Brevibacillus borstelensis TaxID=45462 RepID=UPI00287F40F2|nr:DUF2493 domain-containing protein [Brevibacillus borstelensis]WNF07240.1 DUF2493 domain-containing protein [Brevibacillus borstelensis]